jgi:hypothetical protein
VYTLDLVCGRCTYDSMGVFGFTLYKVPATRLYLCLCDVVALTC